MNKHWLVDQYITRTCNAHFIWQFSGQLFAPENLIWLVFEVGEREMCVCVCLCVATLTQHGRVDKNVLPSQPISSHYKVKR